ncbi:MAG: hypothetical protein ACYDH4_10190 [Candidatus Cryosericum sp.]
MLVPRAGGSFLTASILGLPLAAHEVRDELCLVPVRSEPDDALARRVAAETTVLAGKVVRLGRTLHDGTALWRAQALRWRIEREHDDNRTHGEISERVGLLQGVSAQVDGEASLVGRTKRLTSSVVARPLVREGEASTPFVGIDQLAELGHVDALS